MPVTLSRRIISIQRLDWLISENAERADKLRRRRAVKLRQWHDAGYSWAAIADSLGTTKQAIQQYVQRYGGQP